MADIQDDQKAQPDGYGLGDVRVGFGFGYLSGLARGSLTFQRTVAMAETEVLTIAASHKKMPRAPALAESEVLTIAASHTTDPHMFDVTDGGTLGAPALFSTWSQIFSALATGGAQTNGTFKVQVSFETFDHSDPYTADADGWSETGWTNDGTNLQWFNTYSKAALTSGHTYQIQVGIYDTETDTITFDCTSPHPHTDQATGAGFSYSYPL